MLNWIFYLPSQLVIHEAFMHTRKHSYVALGLIYKYLVAKFQWKKKKRCLVSFSVHRMNIFVITKVFFVKFPYVWMACGWNGIVHFFFAWHIHIQCFILFMFVVHCSWYNKKCLWVPVENYCTKSKMHFLN